RRRQVPDLSVDARHWTGEARGVGDSGGGPRARPRGCGFCRGGPPAAHGHGPWNGDFGVGATRLPIDRERLPDGSTTWKRSPGGLVTALEPLLRRRRGAWIGWAGQTRPGERPDATQE